MTMKRLVFLLMVLTYYNLCAQTRNFKTEGSIRSYLIENVLNLDPIEGIYEVDEQIVQRSFLYSDPKVDKRSNTIAIVKSSGQLICLSLDGKISDNYKVSRIGDTNIYRITFFRDETSVSEKSVLQDRTFIDVKFDIPEEMKQKIFGTIGSAVKVSWSTSLIKTYPTKHDFETAVLEKEQKNQPAVVDQNQVWTGSGFALSNRYIVTNYHVIDNAKSIEIQGINNDFNVKYKARLIYYDKNVDLAILEISDSRFKGFNAIPYSIQTTLTDVGENIFVLGFPLTSTMGDEIKLTTGVISSKSGFQGDVSLYQISAPVQPGNSGGPLFNSKGNIIGIVSAKYNGAENVGYAVKSSYLKILVENCGSEIKLPSNNTISTLPLTEKIKRIKNFVFYIVCSNQELKLEEAVLPPRQTDNSVNSKGENIVLNPQITIPPANEGLIIKRVIVSDKQTIVDFEYDNSIGGWRYDTGWWVNISGSTYLEDPKSSSKYTLLKAIGIPISPNRYTFASRREKLSFSLIFPALPKNVTTFNLIENELSPWKFIGVKLR